MRAAVGLFEDPGQISAVQARLEGAGFATADMRVVKSVAEMDRCMKCNLGAKIREDITVATLLGTFIFVVFGLLGAVGAVRVTGATSNWGLGAVVVFALIGAFCGGFLGWVLGAANAEQELQDYRDAVSHGGILIMVQAEQERVNKAMTALRQAKAVSARTCIPLEEPADSRQQSPVATGM